MKNYVPLIQTALWVILILLALLIFQQPLKERIERGDPIKVFGVEIGGLKNEIGVVKKELDSLDQSVSKLFLMAMSEGMYFNLKKLDSGKFGEYKKWAPLEGELRHLRDVGYIKVDSIDDIPDQGDDLSIHVTVTDAGHRFVQLRESAEISPIGL
ncbi:hypothetical protein [Streptomyces sp. YGL11-2]|uniref:hypothetical protein n=1 Tax=Streptomyces sp. YGL11-2 TaxID=3414028 RepID=UPI003CF75D2D